jgi:glutathione S-transferase
VVQLVEAVFGQAFRYFDLLDASADLNVSAATPKVRASRAALAARPSVRDAVAPGYPDLLSAFLVRHEAYLLKAAAPQA